MRDGNGLRTARPVGGIRRGRQAAVITSTLALIGFGLSVTATVATARIATDAAPARPFLGPAAASAVTPAHVFTVNTTADTHDATPGNGACNDGTGHCSIRAGVEESNGDPSKLDQIKIPAGLYPISMGELDVTNPTGLVITGAGAGSTKLDGGSNGSNRVFDIADGATTTVAVTISGLTVQNTAAGNNSGAGLYNQTLGATTLLKDTFLNNTSAGSGGAIDNQGTLWVTGSTFKGNHANGSGGGIYQNYLATFNTSTFTGNSTAGSGGGVYINYPTTITSSTFTGNSAVNGGGVYCNDTAQFVSSTISSNTATSSGGGLNNDYDLQFQDGWIDHNTAAFGGGIYSDQNMHVVNSHIDHNTATTDGGGIDNQLDMTVTAVTMNANSATRNGGAIFIGSSAYGIVTNSTLSANTASTNGGAAHNDDYLQIDYSTVTGNSAPDGGGAYTDSVLQSNESTWNDNHATTGNGGAINNASGNAAQLTNDTFVGNSAAVDGGALWNASSTNFAVTEVTISGNSAGNAGGGIADQGAMVLRATIVAGNTANGSPNNCSTTPQHSISAGYNLDSGDSCAFRYLGDKHNVNPQLGPLAANGGPTKTEALMDSSPAINAAGKSCATSIDQRGMKRPAEGACDIGAYEESD